MTKTGMSDDADIKWLTYAELAKARGVDRPRVRRWDTIGTALLLSPNGTAAANIKVFATLICDLTSGGRRE